MAVLITFTYDVFVESEDFGNQYKEYNFMIGLSICLCQRPIFPENLNTWKFEIYTFQDLFTLDNMPLPSSKKKNTYIFKS